MFDIPSMLIPGERRLVLHSTGEVVELYQNLRAKFSGEGVVQVF